MKKMRRKHDIARVLGQKLCTQCFILEGGQPARLKSGFASDRVLFWLNGGLKKRSDTKD